MLHVPYVMGSSDVVKNDIIEPKMEYSPAVQEVSIIMIKLL